MSTCHFTGEPIPSRCLKNAETYVSTSPQLSDNVPVSTSKVQADRIRGQVLLKRLRIDLEIMDVSEVFRGLVTGQYIDGTDYATKFTFQTVFYTSPYTYWCCPCGFQHEFLDYIKENGDINEEVYDQIVQSIVDGKCPHVTDKISLAWVKETSLTGYHIIAASTNFGKGYHEVKKRYQSGIFKLELYNIALIKGELERVIYYFQQDVQNYGSRWEILGFGLIPILYCTKPAGNSTSMSINKAGLLEAVVQTGNAELLENFLNIRYNNYQYFNCKVECQVKHCDIRNAFRYAVRQGLSDVANLLMEYWMRVYDFEPQSLKENIMCASLYKQPEILQKLLKHKSLISIEMSQIKLECYELCEVLKRSDCLEVLHKYNFHEKNESLETQQVLKLLLDLLRDYDDIGDEIIKAIQAIPEMEKECANYNLLSQTQLEPPQWLEKIFHDVPLLLDIAGEDTPALDEWVSKLLAALNNLIWELKSSKTKYDIVSQLRLYVKQLIDGNFDLEGQTAAVELGFNYDIMLYSYVVCHGYTVCPGLYQTDSKEHGILVSEDQNLALNFFGPVLLECGFPAKRQVAEYYLSGLIHQSVHPAVQAYMRNYIGENLDKSKPLTKICRDALRKHFRGKKIHKFLDISSCPRAIKDFLLMKYLQ